MEDFREAAERAANLKAGSADTVSLDEFWRVYPQFSGPTVDPDVTQMMLDQANAIVQKKRWQARWKLGVCLYTAHLLTLYFKTLPASLSSSTPAELGAAGQSSGSVTSKSVDGVSVGYGASEATGDLVGYGSLKDTIYGQQFASMARLVGRGMMVVR